MVSKEAKRERERQRETERERQTQKRWKRERGREALWVRVKGRREASCGCLPFPPAHRSSPHPPLPAQARYNCLHFWSCPTLATFLCAPSAAASRKKRMRSNIPRVCGACLVGAFWSPSLSLALGVTYLTYSFQSPPPTPRTHIHWLECRLRVPSCPGAESGLFPFSRFFFVLSFNFLPVYF